MVFFKHPTDDFPSICKSFLLRRIPNDADNIIFSTQNRICDQNIRILQISPGFSRCQYPFSTFHLVIQKISPIMAKTYHRLRTMLPGPIDCRALIDFLIEIRNVIPCIISQAINRFFPLCSGKNGFITRFISHAIGENERFVRHDNHRPRESPLMRNNDNHARSMLLDDDVRKNLFQLSNPRLTFSVPRPASLYHARTIPPTQGRVYPFRQSIHRHLFERIDKQDGIWEIGRAHV